MSGLSHRHGWLLLAAPLILLAAHVNAQVCQWQDTPGTNIFGGTIVPADTIDACKAACVSVGTANCQSIDFAFVNPSGQRCFILKTQSGKVPANWNVTHSDLVNCPICNWVSYPNANIFGGTQNAATSPSSCQAACQATTGCQSIDFVATNPAGTQCYLLNTQNGRQSATWNVTHYDYVCGNGTGSIPLITGFTGMQSVTSTPAVACWNGVLTGSHMNGGLANPAPDVNSCKQACQNIQGCVAIDWDNTRPAGSQCFYLTSKTPVTASSGVDHYDRC